MRHICFIISIHPLPDTFKQAVNSVKLNNKLKFSFYLTKYRLRLNYTIYNMVYSDFRKNG